MTKEEMIYKLLELDERINAWKATSPMPEFREDLFRSTEWKEWLDKSYAASLTIMNELGLSEEMIQHFYECYGDIKLSEPIARANVKFLSKNVTSPKTSSGFTVEKLPPEDKE